MLSCVIEGLSKSEIAMKNLTGKCLLILIFSIGILSSCNDDDCKRLERNLVGTWFGEGTSASNCYSLMLEITRDNDELFIEFPGSDYFDYSLVDVEDCTFKWVADLNAECFPNAFCELIGELKGDQLEITANGTIGSMATPLTCDYVLIRQ